MHYEGNDRYQFQPWYVKAYRQIRYRPLCWYRGLLMLARWAVDGMPVEPQYIPTRRLMAAFIWKAEMVEFDIDAGHYYSMDEVRTELKRRRKP